MTKGKSPKPEPSPPPLPPPLISYGSNVESDDQSPGDSVPPVPRPRDLRKYMNNLPPPAFHLNPQLAYQAQQSQVASSLRPVHQLSPFLAAQSPYFNQYAAGPSGINSASSFSNSFPSNYLRRNNLTYDPAAHGVISRLAEERTRSTFSSVESVLDAFSSINTILDSTYTAIHGSFKTITGVADHLIFVRNHLAEIALFPRVLQIVIRFCRWLLQVFGLDGTKLGEKLATQNDDQIWNEALSKDFSSSENIKQLLTESGHSVSHSSPLWPIFVFFSLVLGTPYIIWRLLGASGSIPRTNYPEWTLRSGRHFVAVGLYDFKARNGNELSFAKNQILFVKPESLKPGSKWLIACEAPDAKRPGGTSKIGFIPLNYVKLVMK